MPTIDNKVKNPLRLVNIFFSVFFAFYILTITYTIAKGAILTEGIASQKLHIIGLCMCGLFIVCYSQENILAWWVALFDTPVMFVCSTLIKNRDIGAKNIFAFIVVFSLVLCYLKSKYAAYKGYINRNDQLILESATEADLYKKSKWYDSQNPLSLIFVVAVILGITASFNIIAGRVIITNSEIGQIGYLYQVVKLLVISVFVFCYWKKTIFAWWVALLYGPILWLIHFILQPFQITQVISPLSSYIIVAGYLVIKYRTYNDYIMKQATGFNNTS